MAEPLYDLYFSGTIIQGEDPDLVRARIGKLFSADDAMLDRLFSGQPLRIKSGINQESAIHYRVALRDAGALLEIRPQQPTGAGRSQPQGSNPTTNELSLLPPNTGTLVDCAPSVKARPIPDISRITLAPAGTVIDTSEPDPPSTINNEGFTMTAPNSGSLEDCERKVTPSPIPDISHLDIDNS